MISKPVCVVSLIGLIFSIGCSKLFRKPSSDDASVFKGMEWVDRNAAPTKDRISVLSEAMKVAVRGELIVAFHKEINPAYQSLFSYGRKSWLDLLIRRQIVQSAWQSQA